MFFVTGATGNVGREVVSQLLEEGAKVRGLTRDAGAAAIPDDAEPVVANLASDPMQAADALDGVSAVFLNTVALGDNVAEFLALARRQGVRRVVLLSSGYVRDGAAHDAQPGFVARKHRAEEEMVEASGLEWTALRPDDFAGNALFEWAAQLRAGDVVRGAYAEAATAVIHERDIAAVAVRALLEDGHTGRHYRLTGPEWLTERDRVRIIGEVTGRPVRFEEISPQDARAAMITSGLPGEIADAVLGDLAAAVHRTRRITDTVPLVTGRPALAFAQWVSENSAAFQG
ncbi:NAD(P)H-binding protein [Nonomuraea sp. NPDC050153]|uniref:NAD(P)H-binding protein n=1 Tax=Nonomuraea sp. NPDC050153 TaxID=3364359 RepID=UPI00378777C9